MGSRESEEDYCNVLIQDSPDTINVLMMVDAHYIARAQVEAAFREMEAIVVRAAFDPTVPVGV